MKIVYVYDAIARIGGVERILVDKMNYLSDHYHHDVYLITAAQGNHGYSFPLSQNVKHIDINVRFHLQYQYKYPKRLWVRWKMDYLFRKELKKQVKNIDPDIIIGTTYYKADVICELKCRAKKIIESHCAKRYTGIDDGVNRNFISRIFQYLHIKKYNKLIEKKSDVLIVLTEEEAKRWKTKSQLQIIPNSLTHMPSQSSRCNANRAIAVGRLSHQKGFDRLIQVWEIVYHTYPEWTLVIYGEGPDKNKLEEQIRKAGLEKVITIFPFTHDIKQIYLDSSIYILSSNYEGFGLVLIEAMAYGLPCVSFNCPHGPSEIIKDKADGFLIENGDIEGMGKAICKLIADKSLRTKFGENAKKNVNRFSPKTIMPILNNLFNAITIK